MNPKEQALEALGNARTFCQLLSDARMHGVRGAWSGSAFRSHPCGIIRGTIKMTNDWHVDNTCSIKITDGEGWSNDYCRDSLAHGNPHPQPVNGKAFTVWSSGKWQTDELRERIEPAVVDILCDAITRIAESKEDMRVAKQLAADEYQREQQAGLNAALTKVQP